MEIYTLPNDLALDDSFAIQVFDYETSRECSKQKVSLSQNTISFLLDGHKEVITDRASISIQSSNFLIMKSGNCLMTEKLSSENNHYRSILLFFNDELVNEFIRNQNISSEHQPTEESVFSVKYDDFLTTYVESLINIEKLNPSIQKKILKAKFTELMLYLVELKGVDFLYALTSSPDQQIRNFLRVVENNKLNKLTLKELAFLANMSVSTFKREFEKQFGESPSKWFQEKRLDHAAFLLKEKSKRPTEVFEVAGYETLSNFIQAFKYKFGKTPKQFQAN
ncbi:MAG: AraC family transcriptional regulator [Bacteroidota bacterium]